MSESRAQTKACLVKYCFLPSSLESLNEHSSAKEGKKGDIEGTKNLFPIFAFLALGGFNCGER